MGGAATIGNDHNIHRVIRNTSRQKLSVSEVIKISDNSLFHFRRWVEHFKEQFSCPVTVEVPFLFVGETT